MFTLFSRQTPTVINEVPACEKNNGVIKGRISKNKKATVVCLLLEGCVSENRDSQEQRGDSATEIGYDGQDLLIIRVHRSPGDILQTKAHL